VQDESIVTPAAPPDPAPAAISLQGFRIGEHRFLIGYGDAIELEEMSLLTSIPGAPPWVAGLVNLHGSVTLALDWRPLLGAAPASTAPAAGAGRRDRPMLLCVRHHGDSIGLIVDGLVERRDFLPQEQTPGTAASGGALVYAPWVVRAFQATDGIWRELDMQRFLDDLRALHESRATLTH
jgi:chemotaxis signal transduction protein